MTEKPLHDFIDMEVYDVVPASQYRELKEALADAVDVAVWLTGLPCLNPESEAWAYWESGARPKLDKAMDLLEDERRREGNMGGVLHQEQADHLRRAREYRPDEEPWIAGTAGVEHDPASQLETNAVRNAELARANRERHYADASSPANDSLEDMEAEVKRLTKLLVEHHRAPGFDVLIGDRCPVCTAKERR